ncbi:MAG: fibronectin type III domain-containing protein [Desulfobacteraceae bacterium]|nr:fibronectin type III domain-containing protein [Desulfobacteraceae bacterium]
MRNSFAALMQGIHVYRKSCILGLLNPAAHCSGLLVLISLLILPFAASASVEITLAWDTNNEPELAGYRVYCREGGQDYDYDNPYWEGAETTCAISELDETTPYYFVVRAFDTSNNESGNSNEVSYQGEYEYQDTEGGEADGGGGCFVATAINGQPFNRP